MRRTRRRMTMAEWCFLVFAISLYVASFALPALKTGLRAGNPGGPYEDFGPMAGYAAYVWAWRFGCLSWWANPCLWAAVALILIRRLRVASLIALAGVGFALAALGETPFRDNPEAFPLVGYWVWVSGHSLIAALYLRAWLPERARPSAVPIEPPTPGPEGDPGPRLLTS